MKTQKINSIQFFLLAIFVLASFTSHADFYISIGKPSVEIGGDMDGRTFVGGGGSSEVLPEQDDGDGTKFSLGAYEDDISFDFSLVRTDHDGQWAGIPLKSEFQSLNMDLKGSVLGSGNLRGLAIVGLGFSSVTVKDGSTDGFRVEDAKFKGLDLRFGIGARYRIIKNLALEFNAIQRWGSYNSVDGIVSGSIEDSIDGDGITTSLELLYIFAD